MKWTEQDFIKASQPDWMQIPAGVFVVTGECPVESRPLSCDTENVNNEAVMRYSYKDTSAGHAYFNRPRSSRHYEALKGGHLDYRGRVAVGLRVPKYSMMRSVRSTYFRGLPVGTMIRGDKDKLWRIIDRLPSGAFVMHGNGDRHAFARIHPSLGITDYFNHRKFARTPFQLKQFDQCEYSDFMSIMFPTPEDVETAKLINAMNSKGQDLSKFCVMLKAIAEDGTPAKVYANDWAMLEDLCA